MEEKELAERGTNVERIVYFSDAVFAIAITLLALEIRVPAGLSPAELTASLAGMWPKYLSYLISFTVIGSFWMAHHRIFRYIRAYDAGLIYLNLLFLMCVAVVPFSASLIGEYGTRPVAFEIYASNVTAAGLFLGGMWWYATRDGRLTGGSLSPRLIRQLLTEQLSLPVTGLIFVPITFFFGIAAASFSVIAFLLVAFAVGRVLPRLRARAQAEEQSRRKSPKKEDESKKETKRQRA